MWSHPLPRHKAGIFIIVIQLILSSVLVTEAHVGAWHKGIPSPRSLHSCYTELVPFAQGMYCMNGTSGRLDQNANEAVQPLYMVNPSDFRSRANLMDSSIFDVY